MDTFIIVENDTYFICRADSPENKKTTFSKESGFLRLYGLFRCRDGRTINPFRKLLYINKLMETF